MTTGTVTAALDGSAQSAAAADWAADEAVRRGMSLRLVHAWLWNPLDAAVALDPDLQERWALGVLRDGEARVRTAHPELEVTTELLADEPVPALVAAGAGTDLLVLGSRGHGTVLGYLLGSVSLRVLRQATRPVVVARAPRPGEASRPLDEVVVGVGETGSRDRDVNPVLEFAFAAAAARGATLRAVRAWTIPPVFAWDAGSMRLADEAGGLEPLQRRELADALEPWRKEYPDVPVVEHVEIGSAPEVLVSNGGRAALTVVGVHDPDARLRRLGSTVHAVLHHAPAAVAVVPG
ncbi:universal stress protein [Streptomyces pactum]|uniref:Universal stress protein n=1 Tax=Streptomyces pactum TaxID=68249 RepID=A0ABS0NFI3_9ACTN|nr:universal stress protein [Streptomyces pactum]MBH5333953.1 universal stress protein [Streptomyces pactum]